MKTDITTYTKEDLNMLLQSARNAIEAIQEYQPRIITWEEIDMLEAALNTFNDVNTDN